MITRLPLNNARGRGLPVMGNGLKRKREIFTLHLRCPQGSIEFPSTGTFPRLGSLRTGSFLNFPSSHSLHTIEAAP